MTSSLVINAATSQYKDVVVGAQRITPEIPRSQRIEPLPRQPGNKHSNKLHTPAQRRGVDWRIPVFGQFIIQAYKGNRSTRHIQRGNVIPYQVAGNSDPLAMQDAMQGIEHDIQFDKRRPSHAIDHGQDLITCLEAQVFDDGSSKHLGYLECRGKLSTPAPRFAMDANANLHFVLTP